MPSHTILGGRGHDDISKGMAKWQVWPLGGTLCVA